MLLERVSSYVYYRSMKDHGEPRKVKIEFSERGGINYDEIKGYLQLIKNQELMGQSFLQSGQINWDVIDPELVEVYAHKTRISMIFPDIVASAFYKACDKYERNKPVDPRAAIRLEPRMCRPKDQASRSAAGFGVKLMPAPKKANLEKDQEQIFRFYGYKF